MVRASTDKSGGYALPVFPFKRPPELDGRHRRYRVVVIGAGLAGLTAAVDLAQHGIDVVVLDEDNTVGVRGASSRGICYAQRSLEIFARLGIAQRVLAKGVTWSVTKVLSGEKVLYEYDLARTHTSLQPPFVNLQQFYIEWFLADRFEELNTGEIRWSSRVTGVAAHDDHTVLDVTTPEGDYRLEADWVLDAEGASSFVRETLGLQVSGERTPDRWCITDVRVRAPLPHERWTWVDAPFNEGRGVWQHLMADDVWRLDFQMDEHCDPAEVSRTEVAEARVRKMLGDVPFELVWVGPYFYRTQLLDSFRHRRILFLGDAAHVKSPFGARGGNSGIQDADNLVWKLALVLRGEADEALLATYDEERRAAAQTNIRVTQRSGRFMRPANEAEHVFRRAVLSLAGEHVFARGLLNTGRLCTPHDYRGMSAFGAHGAGVGASVPNVELNVRGETRSLMTLAARSHGRLMLFVDDACPDLEALRAALVALPVDVYVLGRDIAADEPARTHLCVPHAGAALIRPDSHLAAIVACADVTQVRAAVACALGQPTLEPERLA
ncbi:3-(3-hydroxy-phenyl)propionate hydroxylase [Paraburkholderia unamae]|uniref:FAD-dependent oxidoreductase n=1 Tax=Paraburkholderia unamae TaxID=219649 RepID=UPI000DC398C9|nr:FAD-dependent oxidoreductase [Paraburkholderia unamae]RAR65980.1 3-(3-hydroxy-phenyl)propionate hydroxylase [Paraburkholderia unamae]